MPLSHLKTVRHQRPRQRPHPLLFRVAFARARPCYFYGCICLTPEEKAYERRVFRLARAWAKMLKAEHAARALDTQSAPSSHSNG